MSKKIIGLTGEVLSSDKEDKSEDNKIESLVLFDDVTKFTKMGMIAVQSPKGETLIPLQKLLQSYLFNIYGMMNHCKVKDMMIHIHDGSSEIVLEKAMKIELGNIDASLIAVKKKDSDSTEDKV